jgi:cytochrome c biogenesis protein CcmG/thiol:disulfide interchange protein DsbE
MKFIITAALLVLAGGAHGYEVGDTVEDFTLPDLEGIEVSLHDHVGEIIVLNFFTTWCPGCNEEAAHLEGDIWQVYADQGVTVIAVDIQEFPALVQGWAAAQGVTYAIWMAPDWSLFYQFPQSAGIPYNAVLDKNLVIRYASLGFDLNAITSMVEEIIDENQVPVAGSSWGGIKALFN